MFCQHKTVRIGVAQSFIAFPPVDPAEGNLEEHESSASTLAKFYPFLDSTPNQGRMAFATKRLGKELTKACLNTSADSEDVYLLLL